MHLKKMKKLLIDELRSMICTKRYVDSIKSDHPAKKESMFREGFNSEEDH